MTRRGESLELRLRLCLLPLVEQDSAVVCAPAVLARLTEYEEDPSFLALECSTARATPWEAVIARLPRLPLMPL